MLKIHLIVFLYLITLNSIIVISKPIDVTGENIKYYKLTPNEGSGSYNFNYGTHDGSERSERGYIKMEPGSDKPLLVISGTFKYPDEDGGFYEVSYIADEQGYRIVPKEELPLSQIKQTNQRTVVPKLPIQLQPPKEPRGESKLITVNIVKPVTSKPIECPPGKCSGTRQSKVIQIKTLKFS